MDGSIARFATARPVAERLFPEHFDEIGRLHRDPEVMKTPSADGNILPDEVTREGLRQADEPWERHGFGLWAFWGRRMGGSSAGAG
jgi:hypothetical protein